jgi:hypothetical protein
MSKQNNLVSLTIITVLSAIAAMPVLAEDAQLQADSFTQAVTLDADEPGSFSIYATVSDLESPKPMPMQKVDIQTNDKPKEIKSFGIKPTVPKAKNAEPKEIRPDGVKSKVPMSPDAQKRTQLR